MYIKSLFPDVPPTPQVNAHVLFLQRPEQANWPDYTLHINPVTGQKRSFRDFLDSVYDGATALGAPVVDGGLGLRGEDGEIVGILSEASTDYINLVHSCLVVATPFAMMSSYSTAFELTHTLRLSKVTRLFVHPDLLPLARSVAEEIGFSDENIYTIGGQANGRKSLRDIIDHVRTNRIPRISVRSVKRDTLAYLVFSSGTSGPPKAVMISHGNIIFAMQQSNYFSQDASAIITTPPPQTQEVFVSLALLPLHHSYGLIVFCFRAFFFPATLVLLPKWDVDLALQSISKYRVTHMNLIPSVIHQLVHHPKIHEADFSSIQTVNSGAAYLPASLARKMSGFLVNNSAIGGGYGLSECTLTAMVTPYPETLGGRFKHVQGSTGILMPGMEARIVREDGSEADVNEEGELYLKGRNICLGYWNDEKANKETFVDGWLRTGDRFRVDESGVFFFNDRMKDTLKVSGMQVSPMEIEDVLLAHPEKLLIDVAVAGVGGGRTSDEKVPRAWIVLSHDAKTRGVDSAIRSLEAWSQKNLSKYKWLRGGFDVVESIPKSPTGKVLRRVLQAAYEERTQSPQAKL